MQDKKQQLLKVLTDLNLPLKRTVFDYVQDPSGHEFWQLVPVHPIDGFSEESIAFVIPDEDGGAPAYLRSKDIKRLRESLRLWAQETEGLKDSANRENFISAAWIALRSILFGSIFGALEGPKYTVRAKIQESILLEIEPFNDPVLASGYTRDLIESYPPEVLYDLISSDSAALLSADYQASVVSAYASDHLDSALAPKSADELEPL